MLKSESVRTVAPEGGSVTVPTADVILLNATIVTMHDARPRASSIAIAGRRVLDMGDNSEVLKHRGPATDVRDLTGLVLLPGLHDVHNHHALAGRASLSELSFAPGIGAEAILSSIDVHCRALADDGSWVAGGNWGGALIAELDSAQALERLDAASHGHPVVLRDASQHNRWANSAALFLAGITTSTPDPTGGRIARDSEGRATGILIEAAGGLAERARGRAQSEDPLDDERAALHAIALLHSYGITAFQDAGATVPIMGALQRLDDRGELTCWVISSVLGNDPIFGADPTGLPLMARAAEFRTTHHRPDFIKVFLDGVPSTRTAAFLEPYVPYDGRQHDRGRTILSHHELVALLRTAMAMNMSAKIHCTGDAAVRAAMDAIEVVQAGVPHRPPFQIAHGQFVSDADLTRFAALDITADISPPLWFPGGIPSIVSRVLSPERAAHSQPNRTLLDAGARLAAGSDWPVSESPDPWIGMEGLVTRRDPTGRFPGALWPEQAITATEALAAYTRSAAEAMGLGGITGQLRPGASADLVIVDRDPTTVSPTSISSTVVHETWFAGTPVYVRGAPVG